MSLTITNTVTRVQGNDKYLKWPPKWYPWPRVSQKIKIQGHTCLPTIDVLHVMMPPELLVLAPSGGSWVFCLYQGLQLVQLVMCQRVAGRGYSHQGWACRHSVLVVVHYEGVDKWGTQILRLTFSDSFVIRGTSPGFFPKAQDFQYLSSADTNDGWECFVETDIF
jgi:hypothetical protein